MCGWTDHRSWKASDVVEGLTPEDLVITDRRYGTTLGLRECACGFRSADRAEVPDLLVLYVALDDPHTRRATRPWATQTVLLAALWCARRRTARTLLDVGAANGLLVEVAYVAGLDAVGVEPSESLAAAARVVWARRAHLRCSPWPISPTGGSTS